MPADLVPHDAIPKLAEQVDSPAVYWLLRYLQKAGYIKDVDARMAGILQRLTDLGLVDPGYSAPTNGSAPQPALPIQGVPQQKLPIQGTPQQRLPIQGVPQQTLPIQSTPQQQLPYVWVINGNGSRVLKCIESSPNRQEALQPKFKINDQARTAFMSLPDRDQLQALLAVDALVARDPSSWRMEEAIRVGTGEPIYLVPVTSELRAFIRSRDSGEIELADVVREETLRLFLEKYRAGSKAG